MREARAGHYRSAWVERTGKGRNVGLVLRPNRKMQNRRRSPALGIPLSLGALPDRRQHAFQYLIHGVAPGVEDEVSMRACIGESFQFDTVQPLRPVLAATLPDRAQTGIKKDEQIRSRVAPELADRRMLLSHRDCVNSTLAQAASDRRLASTAWTNQDDSHSVPSSRTQETTTSPRLSSRPRAPCGSESPLPSWTETSPRSAPAERTPVALLVPLPWTWRALAVCRRSTGRAARCRSERWDRSAVRHARRTGD